MGGRAFDRPDRSSNGDEGTGDNEEECGRGVRSSLYDGTGDNGDVKFSTMAAGFGPERVREGVVGSP